MSAAPTTHERRPTRAMADALRMRVTRQRNVPWIVLGVLLLVGSSLTFSVWASSLGDRTAVLAVSRALQAGATLEPGDLAVVDVAADGGVPLVPAHRRPEYEGRVLRTDLPSGTLLAPAMVGDGPDVGPGEAVVGMALPPGAVPVDTLHPGAPVLAVEVPAPGEFAEGDAPQGLVWAGTVFAVSTTDDPAAPGGVVVSLLVDSADAPAVAAAAATERIRLVLVHSIGDVASLVEFAATPPPPDDVSAEG